MLEGIIFSPIELVKGEFHLFEWLLITLITLFSLSPFIPIFSTFTLLLHENQKRRQIFTIVAWGLAVGFNLYFGISSYPEFIWFLWGLWLYTALSFGALIFELLVLNAERKTV